MYCLVSSWYLFLLVSWTYFFEIRISVRISILGLPCPYSLFFPFISWSQRTPKWRLLVWAKKGCLSWTRKRTSFRYPKITQNGYFIPSHRAVCSLEPRTRAEGSSSGFIVFSVFSMNQSHEILANLPQLDAWGKMVQNPEVHFIHTLTPTLCI